MGSGRNWAIAVLAATLSLAFGGAAEAQLRVGAEADLGDAGPGGTPLLSYDSRRGVWQTFWYSERVQNDELIARVVTRRIDESGRAKHDSYTLPSAIPR